MHSPDHNTLWRFFQRNELGLSLLLKLSVLVAMQAELVGLVFHALDGTKIAVDVSPRSAWHGSTLEKLQLRETVCVALETFNSNERKHLHPVDA